MPEFNYPHLPDPDEPDEPPAPMESPRPEPADESDRRLYVHNSEGWTSHIKQGWEKQYCYSKFPGEDHFHLIINGEIFLEHGSEKLCLTCAFRRGIITTERLFWQKKPRKATPRQI